eukprot:8425-Hanusia_phi.AAC.3
MSTCASRWWMDTKGLEKLRAISRACQALVMQAQREEPTWWNPTLRQISRPGPIVTATASS